MAIRSPPTLRNPAQVRLDIIGSNNEGNLHASTEMDYGHGDEVASHCHAEDQLIYAASGVMRVSSEGGSW